MGKPRRGIAIFEAFVAAALLAVIVSVAIQALAATAALRRAADRRAMALEEAANLVERVAALSWADLTSERLADLERAAMQKLAVPASSVKIKLRDDANSPNARLVRVEICWNSPAGNPELPVGLSYWAYPSGEGAP